MEEQYNRVIRLEKMTYREALHLCYGLLQEKVIELDKIDVHGQGLSMDYQTAILLLTELYLHSPDDITHNKNI